MTNRHIVVLWLLIATVSLSGQVHHPRVDLHLEQAPFEELVKEIIADYPDEYITELEEIADDSIANAMRTSYYVLAGVFGIALAVALFLPKRKLASPADDSKNSRDGPENISDTT